MKMRFKILIVALFISTPLAVWAAISDMTNYKTFGEEILTFEDLNALQTAYTNKLNEIIALTPGSATDDSLKVDNVASDTLSTKQDPQITVKDELASASADDSLNFHRANVDRLHLDSLWVGSPVPATWPAFAVGTSAGTRVTFAYLDIDSLSSGVSSYHQFAGALDWDQATPTSITFSDGTSIGAGYVISDTVAVRDSLSTQGSVGHYQKTGVASTFSVATTASFTNADETVVFSGGISANGTSTLGTVTVSTISGDGSALTGLETVLYDSTLLAGQDTTITSAGTASGGAHKIVAWDDRQALHNCVNFDPSKRDPCAGSLSAARVKETTLSMFQASRGDTALPFPVVGEASITVGKDSLVIRNSLNGDIHSVFVKEAGGPFGNNDLNDLVYRDRQIRIATAGNVTEIDFLTDAIYQRTTSGIAKYAGNLQERDGALTATVINASPALANNALEYIAVTRNIFGKIDPLRGFGPAHHWAVNGGTNSGVSVYTPHANAIYDQGATSTEGQDVAISERGRIWSTKNNSGSDDYLSVQASTGASNVFAYVADGFADAQNIGPASSGQLDLAWASTPIAMEVESANDNLGLLGENTSRVFLWASGQGAYILHPPGDVATMPLFGKQRLSSTVNAPPEIGATVLAAALEDNTTDSSPHGHTLTANGSPGTVSAVFGDGYSGKVGAYLSRTDADLCGWIEDTSVSLHWWFKRDTIGSNAEPMITCYNGGTPYATLTLTGTNGYFDLNMRNDATTAINLTSSAGFDDNQWHHAAMTQDAGLATLYIDGQVVAQGSYGGGTTTLSEFRIGHSNALVGGAEEWNGLLDDVVVSDDAMSAETIAAIHESGRGNLDAPHFLADDALYSNAVASMDGRDNGNGDMIIAFTDAFTAQLFNGRSIIDTFALGENLKGAAFLPDYGQDSAAVVIWGATKRRTIRPTSDSWSTGGLRLECGSAEGHWPNGSR